MPTPQSITIAIKAAYEGAKAIVTASRDLDAVAKSSAAAEKELAELQKQSKALGGFKTLTADLKASETALDDARRHMDALGKEMDQAQKPTQKLQREYKASVAAVKKLETEVARQTQGLKKQKKALADAGIDTNHFSKAQALLQSKIVKATKAAVKQRKALNAQTKAQKRLAAEQKKSDAGQISRLKRLDVLSKRVAAGIAGYFGVRFFAGAIQGAADLETQLDRVSSVSATYAERIADITRESKKLGATTAFTSKQAADGFEEFARAGIDVDTAIASMANTLALAKAESIGLAQAAAIVTNNLRRWRIDGETAATITDKLKAGASNASVTVTDLNEAMADSAPMAQAMGLSLDQTIAITAKFIEVSKGAAQGGTAMKIILGQLEDPASKARIALAALGFEGSNFVGALDAMKKAGSRADVAIRAFGTEAGPQLRALLRVGTEGIGKLTETISRSEGAAKSAAGVMAGNLNGALISLSSAWSAVKGELAAPLLEPLAEQVRVLAKRFQAWVADGTIGRIGEGIKTAFNSAVTAVKEFIRSLQFQDATAKFDGFAGKVKAGLADLLAGFKDFQLSIGGVFTALTAAWNGFMATVKIGMAAIAGLATAISLSIQGIVEVLALMDQVSAQTLEKFRLNTLAMAAATQAMADSAGEDLLDVGRDLGLVADKANEAGDALKTVGAKIAGTGAGLTGVEEPAKAAIQALDAIGIATSITADELDDLSARSESTGAAVAESSVKIGGSWEKLRQQISGLGEKMKGTFSVIAFEGRKTQKDVNEAFARMGIQTQESMTTLAEQTRKDWETIRRSGEATAAGMESAAKKYIESWKAAHGGVLPRLQDMTIAHGDLWLAILEVKKAEKEKQKATEEATKSGVTGAGKESEAVRLLREEKDKLKNASEDASVAGVKGTKAEIEALRKFREELAKTIADKNKLAEEDAAPRIQGGSELPYRENVEAQGDAQALADFDRQVANLSNRIMTMEQTLNAYQGITERVINQSDDRARAAATKTAATPTTPASASSVPAATSGVKITFNTTAGAQAQATVTGAAQELIDQLTKAAQVSVYAG